MSITYKNRLFPSEKRSLNVFALSITDFVCFESSLRSHKSFSGSNGTLSLHLSSLFCY